MSGCSISGGFDTSSLGCQLESDITFLTKSYVWTRGTDTVSVYIDKVKDREVTTNLRKFLDGTNFNTALLNLIKDFIINGRCFFQIQEHPKRIVHFNVVDYENIVNIGKDQYGDINYTEIKQRFTVSAILAGLEDGTFSLSPESIKRFKEEFYDEENEIWFENNYVTLNMIVTDSYEKALKFNPKASRGKTYVIMISPYDYEKFNRRLNPVTGKREHIYFKEFNDRQLYIATYPMRNSSDEPTALRVMSGQTMYNYTEITKAVLDATVMGMKPPITIVGENLKHSGCIDLSDYGVTTVEGNADIKKVYELSAATQIGMAVAAKEETNVRGVFGLNRLLDTYASTVHETVARQSVRGMHMQTVSEEIYKNIITVMINGAFDVMSKKKADKIGYDKDLHTLVYEGLAYDDTKAEHIQKTMVLMDAMAKLSQFDKSIPVLVNSAYILRDIVNVLNINGDILRRTDGTMDKPSVEDILTKIGMTENLR